MSEVIQSNGKAEFVTGLLFGVAVGAAIGVVFAPWSGKDTRKKIVESSERFREGAARTYEQVNEGMSAAINKGREAVQKGRETFENGRASFEAAADRL